jgi:hypothetical protein
MSGGHFDYLYWQVEETYVGQMEDYELDEMMKDLCDLLHDLEWWQSADYSEDTYRETVKKFKEKWFGRTDTQRLKEVSNKAVNEFDKLLKNVFGLK